MYLKAGENQYINNFCTTVGTAGKNYCSFSFDKRVAASGNIMWLLDNESPSLEIPTLENLYVDSTRYSLRNAFSGCSTLVTAPKLPATALNSYCYTNMFDGCTSLTVAPELPA